MHEVCINIFIHISFTRGSGFSSTFVFRCLSSASPTTHPLALDKIASGEEVENEEGKKKRSVLTGSAGPVSSGRVSSSVSHHFYWPGGVSRPC